jgi:hypothetical protein
MKEGGNNEEKKEGKDRGRKEGDEHMLSQMLLLWGSTPHCFSPSLSSYMLYSLYRDF